MNLLTFVTVQSFSCVQLFATPWTAARQTSLSFTISQGLLKLMSFEWVMPSKNLICCPLLLLPWISPRIRVFSSESALHIRWPKYWSFSFSISLSNEHPGLISFRMDWLDLRLPKYPLSFQLSLQFVHKLVSFFHTVLCENPSLPFSLCVPLKG